MKNLCYQLLRIITAIMVSGIPMYYSCDENKQPDSGMSVEELFIHPETLKLIVGETGELEVSYLPENADCGEIYWTSSDESVVMVDENGLVTALAKGTAAVTATEESSKVAGVCEVTVSGIPVDTVTLDKTGLDMMVGDIEMLTATVSPVNADDSEVSWTSSDVAVATVTQNGEVTAVAAGSAIITAEAGGIAAQCPVAVASPAKLWDYYYDDGSWSTDLNPAKTVVGIIYLVNEDGKSGKVVSLDEFSGEWGLNDEVTEAIDDMDGKINTEAIWAISGWEESYPLFKWCADRTQGGLEWYIPAKKELRQLYAGMSGLIWVESGAISSRNEVNDWGDYYSGLTEYSAERTEFNERVGAVEGATIFNTVDIYWSSMDSDGFFKWAVDFRNGNTTIQFYDARRLGRAVAQF